MKRNRLVKKILIIASAAVIGLSSVAAGFGSALSVSACAGMGGLKVPEVIILPGVGTTFMENGILYEITDMDSACIKTVLNRGMKECDIPSEVDYDGFSFKVTKINRDTFKGMKKLKKVTIPESVETIESRAFYGCGNLKKVSLTSDGTIKVAKSAFKKVNRKCSFTVKGMEKKQRTQLLKTMRCQDKK